VARRRAVVIGGGIGGLAAAAGLHAAGWDVTLCERAPTLEPVGAGLALAPNGLRALDVVGAGNSVRATATAVPQAPGIRRRDGRWLTRGAGTLIAERFGDPFTPVTRAAVIDALLARVPATVLRLSSTATSVEPGGSAAARVMTTAGCLDADLVVAADGIRSATRAGLFPAHPGLRYAGFTTWRLLVGPLDGAEGAAGDVPLAESWGRGTVFGVMPLAGGQVYCYAAAPAAEGGRSDDELAELNRMFGTWHQPIPALLTAAEGGQVLRNDVAELAAPLPAFHSGRVALLGDAAHPMTPNLGQGACQALEDAAVLTRLATQADADAIPAALASYTAARLPRATAVTRLSAHVATMSTWTSPAATALRDTLTWMLGKLPPRVAVRSLTRIYDWRPPSAPPETR
jgi:2-polyprenyl-6-methoxyphenol hydroxylase-like FAD-dependent oxidoreductase